jgi:tRNA A37 threonylcarbamoyladenosine dehydratase
MDGAGAGNSTLAGLVERVEALALIATDFPGGVAGGGKLERLLEEGATLFGIRGVGVDAVEALQRELLWNLRVVGGERLVVRLDNRQAVLEPFAVRENEVAVAAIDWISGKLRFAIIGKRAVV